MDEKIQEDPYPESLIHLDWGIYADLDEYFLAK